MRIAACVAALIVVAAAPIAGQTLHCEAPARSEEARRFTVRAPATATPTSSLYDAPLMDPPEDDGIERRMTFSNQCDNAYTLRLDRATLDDASAGVVTGVLEYFDVALIDKTGLSEGEVIPLVCKKVE